MMTDSPKRTDGQELAGVSGYISERPQGDDSRAGASLTFATIVADPPWHINFEAKCNPGTRRVIKSGKWGDPKQDNSRIKPLEYPTMTIWEIAAMRIPVATDAHLYLWTVNSYIEAAYMIARAWGFKPSKLLTWVKSPMGLGLGGTFSSTSEFILFARRGTLKAKRRVDTTWWEWKRGAHSAKPEAFIDLVESISPGPYLELFARRNRLGWSTWGNECLNHIGAVAPAAQKYNDPHELPHPGE